jgi:hypothetical protein
MLVGMTVVRSFNAGNEGDKRGRAGRSNLELHDVEMVSFSGGGLCSQKSEAQE